MATAGPGDLGPPHGAFLVGYAGLRPVCCGRVKRLPDGACELNRMYVVPDARRRPGYSVAGMDTGPRQQHARDFYEREGYLPIGNFNANPAASWWGERRLN